jgi:hypothetical protein
VQDGGAPLQIDGRAQLELVALVPYERVVLRRQGQTDPLELREAGGTHFEGVRCG